jgi:hypothetical protein
MTAHYIAEILGKLGELRNLFVLGQRTLPFLEELFAFLEDISPLLDEINASMQDSTTVKIPRATSQLQSVSQATELATTEILDLIDAVLLKSGQEKERLQHAAAGIEAFLETDVHLLARLRAAGLPPAVLADVESYYTHRPPPGSTWPRSCAPRWAPSTRSATRSTGSCSRSRCRTSRRSRSPR